MNDKIIDVGFIGLGRMGKPMAANILKAGFGLTVYDLRSEAVRGLTELGAAAARSPQELAEQVDLISIAVVDDTQVEEVFSGEGGLINGFRRGHIVAVHSTVSPKTVRRLANLAEAKGAQVIDAPVSGGETGAREKSLTYIVGGDRALLERCREVFSTSAADIFHMGALGSAAAAKMIVQVVTCIHMLAAHEAEKLAEGIDLNFPALQEVLRTSSGQSFVMDHWLDRFKLPQDPIETRRRRTEVLEKSLAPAIRTAQELGLALSGAVLAERLMAQIMGIEDS
jgi:3-hydroxyisobutyrate dehydrogenase-like beta-hydroxyacid dehydrogenase